LFVYESESKASTVVSDYKTYKLFGASDVGLKSALVIGKYSGDRCVISKLNSLGYKVSEKEAGELAEIFRDKAVSLKRALFDSEIIDTYKSYKGKSKKGSSLTAKEGSQK